LIAEKGKQIFKIPKRQQAWAKLRVPSFFKPAKLRSTNGETSCVAIDGGLVMNNPTAAAITHVLHNKVEFPRVEGTKDMLVLSLGTGQFDQKYEYGRVQHWGAFQWAKPVVKIVLDGISDMVDHTVSMSFGLHWKQYVRIQVSRLPGKALKEMDDGHKSNVKKLVKLADEMLASPCMEHVPYGGQVEVLDRSNKDCLDWFVEQLIREHHERGSNTHVHFHDMCI